VIASNKEIKNPRVLKVLFIIIQFEIGLGRVRPEYFQIWKVAKLTSSLWNQIISSFSDFQVFLILSNSLFLGSFKEYPVLSAPAAMSVTLLLQFLVMIARAVEFWLRRWATVAVVIFCFFVN